MKKVILGSLIAALALLTTIDTASAQWSTSNSSSYSNSSSTSWGRQQGIGPSGVYDRGYLNQSGRSSMSQFNSGRTPYGGFSNGRTQTTGFNSSQNYDRGFNRNGFYNNTGGNFNQFNNGSQFNNRWGAQPMNCWGR